MFMQIHVRHYVFVLVYLGLAGRCEPKTFPLDINGVPGHCKGISPISFGPIPLAERVLSKIMSAFLLRGVRWPLALSP